MPHRAQAEARRLLRLLLVRDGAVPADPGAWQATELLRSIRLIDPLPMRAVV
jgi:hypothetical protein